ncbi:MAG TPA: mechanosensitive ion channel protein MscS [Candidatus Omnitrophica bacterium]|uniref:Mechanosensitive ion channel family protein n=1 Tax=Candidatus Kaiserbacteria bacterium GW2011_GWA2_49_19 TaxID=1618669 RepID=A0A0G1VRJ8_9BACT|nr:MAG: Mechanosensitive ion channel family protein [Candidatus Kaiserbacteria bacterium GW2011_GWA2_49_19]HBR15242.1 mechanosensitive ion channel protein MscS [Candidatus Omnitrophota bacterium]
MRIQDWKSAACAVFFLREVFQETSVWSETVSTQAVRPSNIKEMIQMHAETAKNLINMMIEFIVKYSFQALGGVLVLFLGWMVGKYVGRWLHGILDKKKLDITVIKFFISSVKMLIMAFAVIVALGKFGIEIAPLIAGVSVAGFGLSFALQGSLSNYAAGATLIFTKPFKVGDIIEVAGVVGEVTDMKLPRTDIKTVDGNAIFIPNKHIIGEIIHNYSNVKRLDIKVGVSYKSDMEKAIRIVKEVVQADKRVVNTPNAGIAEFGDSSVNLMARLFCKQDDYWNVLFDLNKKIFDRFHKEGVEIPFPQRDVRIIQEGGERRGKEGLS